MKEYKVNAKYDAMIETLSRAFAVSEADVKHAIIRASVTDNEEANMRLRNVFCKAARGEKITIAGIGGSITEGAHAVTWENVGNNAQAFTEELGGEKCWFQRVTEWFDQQFPNTQVKGINAGIGATPSLLGAFRLDQMVMQHKPDLVTVEFSVNDPTAIPYLLKDEILESYESVIRRLLDAGVAVMQVFLVQQDGNSMQNVHREIARHYNVPGISYHDAIYPDGKLICDWVKLSPDDIHPNNAGHALLGICVSNYLDSVLESTDLTAAYKVDKFRIDRLYPSTFDEVYAEYAYQFKDRAEDLEFDVSIPTISEKWQGQLVAENCEGTVKLTVPKGAKRVYVQYFNAKGSFEVSFMGQKTSCNTTPLGWPKALWHRVYTGSAIKEDAEITIKTHSNGKVILQGLLVAF